MKTCDWFLRSSKANDFGCSIASPLLYRRGVIELVDREYQSLQGGSCLESLTNNAGFPRHGSGAGNSLSPPSEQARSDDELENHSMMEIDDDSLSTFYVLNAGDIGEDLVGGTMDVDDVNEGSLIQTITFHSVDNNQESIDNVYPDDLCTIQGVEIIPTSQPENGNGFEQTEEEENEDKSESEAKEDENEEESESSDKEMEPPRFILNLYPPEEGYTYSMADSETEIPESHLIPYSERYVIDSVDNGIVPWKVISALKDRANFDLMSCKNNVLTEIRDYRHFSTVSRTTPKVRHVLLKPNNQCLLSDLDDIIEKGFKEKAKKDAIEAEAAGEGDSPDSQYIEESPEPEPELDEPNLTPSPERIKMEPVDYEAVICKVEPSSNEMTNEDKNNLFTEVNDCKPFSVGSPPIPPAPDEQEDVKPGVQSLFADFKRTDEDNDPEKEASSDTDSQKESDGEGESENSEVDNSGVVVPYCRTSDEDQESLHRSNVESSEEEDATDDEVENLNFRFLRTKCDHRYDKEHYSRKKSFGSSSETDSDSSVDTGSLCDSDNNSDSTSYKRSNSSFSSNNEESNNRTGKGDDSSDNDSDSFINNDSSNAGSESSGSDNGSRGRSKGRKESENEERNNDKKAKSDKEKSIWSVAAVQKAIEDKEYFITNKNPFPPNRMIPRKKKKHRPRDKRKELRGSPSAGFSGNISSNDSENDNSPSTTIVTKGLILKEKHPAGLIKDHQRALFGRELTEQENALFEDEPDTELKDIAFKVHKTVDSASKEFLESKEENIVANLKNAEINIAHLLTFIKEKKQNLVESVRLVEPEDDKLSATPSSSKCLAIQNSSDLETDSTAETIDNDLDATELELVKFEGNTNDDADSVVSEEFDEEEQNIIQEAICGLLDGTHLDVLAEEVNSAIENEFEASLRDLMNETELGVEEHPESEPEEDFDEIASRLQLEIIKVDPKDGSKLVRCPDGLLLMIRGKEITPISDLTDEDGNECSYILNTFSKSLENPITENETTCTTVAVYNDTTQETNTENDNTQTSGEGYRQVEVILSIKEEAGERMEFHVNETSVNENSFANSNHVVNNDKILINGNCNEEGKEKFNHNLATTSTTTVDKQMLSSQNHENNSNDFNHGYGNGTIDNVYNGNGNYPTLSIKNEFKHLKFDGIIIKQEVQCKQEPEEPMEVDKIEPGVKNYMVKVKDEKILSNGTHMEDVDEFLNSVQNKSHTVDEQQNPLEKTQGNTAQESQMEVDVSNQLVLRYETNESEVNTITMYKAAAPIVEVEESTAKDQVVVHEEQKLLESVEETSSEEELGEFNKNVASPNYDELTEEEVEALLNSEGCEKLLHEVTSDLMLEASTDDFLIKGAQLCYIEEMNRFYRNAYEKAVLNRDNPVYSMTEAELEKEIDLEFEASKFYLDSSDDIADLNKLDVRTTSPTEEDLENIKQYEEEFLSKEEMEDFMKFRYSLEDFIPTDEDAQLKKLFALCDEEKQEDDKALEEEYYKYNDEDYFSEQALVFYLKEQLQNAFSQDEDSDEENVSEMVQQEYEEYERVDKERMLQALKKDTELNYDQRLSLEKILINQTSERLCLDPSPDVGVLANRLQYEKLKWNAPELKKAVRNWTVLDQPVENHFHRLLRENPDNEHVRAHLKRKRDPILRQQKPIELNTNKLAIGIKRPRTLLEPRELTLSKLLRGDTEEDNRPVVPPPEEEDGFYEPPEAFHSFFNFVMGVKAGKQAAKDKDKEEPTPSFEEQIANPETRRKMLTLEPPPIIDFMDVETPANLDVLKKVFKAPDPAVIQSFPIENTCRVIEEYLLETDRRKKPHYTKVTIYQRNYLENYHGEVLMESLFEPLPPSPQGKFPRIPPYTTCEFGLGCSSDVALYIKQFLDIFSEDGKRACKVTYHKIGQPFPFVLATPYYKPIFPEPPLPKEFQFTIGPNTVNPYPTYMERSIKFPTQGFTQNLTHLYHAGGPGHAQHHHYTPLNQSNHYSQSNSNSYGFLGQSLYNSSINASTSSSSTSSSSSNSQPPVQIVHPQPRPVQQREQIIASSSAAMSSTQIYGASSGNPVLSQTMQQPAAANVNFNVNLNSSSIVGISPQQVLTRPHIVNVNVQQQAQQSVQTRPVNVPTQQQLQQLAHQRNLRMRQQQLLKHQQYIQQHPTALAKLLTTNLQGHVGVSGANKPITVAVPPQPQNPNKAASNPPQSPVGNLTMSIGSPIEHHPQHPQTVSPSPNVSVNVNTAPNVNVNLNTISLDGLLSGSQSNINYSTSTSNIVTSNVSVVGNNRIGTSISPATALNILRLNAGSGGSGNVNLINTSNLQRGLTVSNLTSNNVSIMSPPQQRILVNSAGNVLATTQNQQQLGELEEISVTDLNTFLNSQQIQISQLGVGQQVALSQNHSQLQQQLQIPQQHIQTLDSHNVNLNLNVNLNSGSGESSQQIAKIQGGDWTTTSNSNAPFVVFISPLTRPLNSENSGQNSLSSGQSSTVNVNLAALQAASHSSQPSQTIVLETTSNKGGQGNQQQQQYDAQNLISSGIVGVTSEGVAVDTLFNALSDAIGPELGKKLDVIGGVVGHNTVVVSSTVNVPISSPVIQSRISPQSHLHTYNLINMQSSPSSSHTTKFTSHVNPSQQNTSVITLNDLLGSPTLVSSSAGGNYTSPNSFILNTSENNGSSSSNVGLSNGGSLLSPIAKPSASPNISGSGHSNVVSSTPRLSALLAGTPSADSQSLLSSSSGTKGLLGENSSSSGSNSLLANAIDASHSTASYGNLLDRLAASLSQPPGTASQIRTGVSRLNPIASATPNVVLEHPMLAASLTQPVSQQSNNRATAYRQIAPAPPPNLVQHGPPQQLINLLGLTSNTTGQARTIRISATTPVTGKPSPGSGNMGVGR